MYSKFSKEYENFLDLDRILSQTENLEALKVVLKKDTLKGTGLYSTKPIYKNEVIAFYKLKVFWCPTYRSPTCNIYSCKIYNKRGYEIKSFIGDINLECLNEPENNIPYWGFFVNEPYPDQKYNAKMDLNLNNIYAEKDKIRPGDMIIYKIIATQYINPDEEICMYYGKDYNRDYETN